MPSKKKRVDPTLQRARAVARGQLKVLSKKSIAYCMELIDFDGSARTYPSSAAQLAWFAYVYRQVKTATHEVVDAFLESGSVTRDESLILRQLRAAPSVDDKKEER